jgi:SOS-response transcriptional repressor LexA
MGKIQKAIVDIIAEKKKIGKLSQRDLARALGCSQASVSQLLSGARGLSETRIEEICNFLGITLGDLENPTPQPVDPKPLRDYLEKLKRLYEEASVPGFKNVTRSIDDWLSAAKEMAAAKNPIPGSNVVIGDFTKPPEIKEAPAIDYDNPKHEHDAPREEIYEELPFFDQFRVPAGKPDEVPHDGIMSVRQVVRHLAKGNRYVIRVIGDSMQPRIEDGDLILVDYAKEPRPGDTVVALINGAAVVKKYLRPEGQLILRSTNSQYADIEVKETDQFQIAGVVLRIVEGAL